MFDWFYNIVLLLLVNEAIKLAFIYARRKKVEEGIPDKYPLLSVIIPARNEENCIGDCLKGITEQTYPQDRYEVMVVDDHSEDRTGEIISEFSKHVPNLSVFTSGPIPDEWSGKSHANHLASTHARGEYLLFMDADVIAKTAMLQRVMFTMLKNKLDVISIVPHRTLISFLEKILLAPLFPIIANTFEERKVKLSGELILFHRRVYDGIGGHTAVKSTVSDDLDFAALLEKTNFKTAFLYAEPLASTRMYDGFASMFEGISKMFQRLLSENEWRAAWISIKYFLFAATSVASLFLFFANFHPGLFAVADVWGIGW
jgi:glycosyltransferase involved in cell wall biosynthesis